MIRDERRIDPGGVEHAAPAKASLLDLLGELRASCDMHILIWQRGDDRPAGFQNLERSRRR